MEYCSKCLLLRVVYDRGSMNCIECLQNMFSNQTQVNITLHDYIYTNQWSKTSSSRIICHLSTVLLCC